MQREISLVDLRFQEMSVEEKRQIFMILDMVMKKYHDNGYMITSFNPKDIYYQNEIFSFSKYERISPINSEDKDGAVFNNIIGLADLAFCSYLPSYDFDKGLLNSEVLSKNYDKFENIITPFDREYYKSVLVESINTRKLPSIPYYYDYVSNKMKNVDSSKDSSNSKAFIKATEAGRLMADKNNEAAFGNTFYLVCMVSAMLIAFVGLGLYFFK